MTVLTIASSQAQSTRAFLRTLGAIAEQDTETVFLLQKGSHTHESDNTVFIVHPMTREPVEIDPEQRWFWTEEWQRGERQVEEDLANGDYEDFDNLDDFFADV